MDDRLLGMLLLLGSLGGIALYFYLVFLSPWAGLVIQLSAFIAVGALLAIMAWIGYTLATTPPPAPLEEAEEASGQEDEKEAADK